MKHRQAAKAKTPTILVVEDHRRTRELLADWLHVAFPHVRCLEAGSGEEAILLADDHAPDIVLMDINLPGINGIHATRCIKAVLRETQVVIVSTHDELFYQEEARAAGATGYVSKRMLFADLIPMVRRLLSDIEERLAPDRGQYP